MFHDIEAAVGLLDEEFVRLWATLGDHANPTSVVLDSVRRQVTAARFKLQAIDAGLQKIEMDLAVPVPPAPGVLDASVHAPMHKGLTCSVRNGRLDVLTDGQRVFGKDNAAVFVQALARLGFERAQDCNLICCGQSLVSRTPPKRRTDGYPHVREYEGWFVITHSNTRTKLGYLKRVLDSLKGATSST